MLKARDAVIVLTRLGIQRVRVRCMVAESLQVDNQYVTYINKQISRLTRITCAIFNSSDFISNSVPYWQPMQFT